MEVEHENYIHAHDSGHYLHLSFETSSGYDEYSVKVDDYGGFWNPVAVQGGLDEVKRQATQGNVIVPLFVKSSGVRFI